MGSAKRYMEEIESRGWADIGTLVCSRCVEEQALVAIVRNHGVEDSCDYCGETPESPEATAPIELVLEAVVDGLKHEYEDPVENMAWDDGYVGTVYDTWDLLMDFGVSAHDKVFEALNDAIVTSQWCQRDPYAATPAQALVWGWDGFRKFVKHSRRYTFLVTDHSTADGAGSLPMHSIPAAIAEAVDEVGLVKVLPGGTPWWRLRPHPAVESYTSAADIGTPPDSIARDNRMTPKGIGAFYGASSGLGARAEVAGYADPEFHGSMGCFRTTFDLSVVDLRNPPPVPSLFDPGRRHLRAAIQFLRRFVEDATQIADPSDTQNLNYVPTQVIAETFRYELGVDGILWRSSKDPSVTSSVLFVPSTRVADLGSEEPSTQLVLDPATVVSVSPPL